MHKTFFDNRFSAKVILQGRAEDVFTSPTLGAKFVLVPAGTFQTGKFGKQRQTTINKPFYIQKTHVTQGQWKKVMEDNPSFFKNGGDDCPVENVSWNDVQKFIIKLNNMEGTDKYRLPTESQWEYAARSGGKLEDYAGTLSESELGDYAWYYVNSGGETHPVGQRNLMASVCMTCREMSGSGWTGAIIIRQVNILLALLPARSKSVVAAVISTMPKSAARLTATPTRRLSGATA